MKHTSPPPVLSEVLRILTQSKPQLRREFGVTKIGLFGSVLNESAKAGSDVDILVELESEDTFSSFFNVKAFLESKLHQRVDLGIDSVLKPSVRKNSQIQYV